MVGELQNEASSACGSLTIYATRKEVNLFLEVKGAMFFGICGVTIVSWSSLNNLFCKVVSSVYFVLVHRFRVVTNCLFATPGRVARNVCSRVRCCECDRRLSSK